MFSKEFFCQRLRSIRLEKGLTQVEVATAIGAKKQYISRWEKGEQEPGLATVCALADYFNVSIDYLVGRSDNPERR